MVTTEEITQVLKSVKDPEINTSIVGLGMVRSVKILGNTDHVEIAPTVANCPMTSKIKDDVTKAVSAMEGVEGVEVRFYPMTNEERDRIVQIELFGRPKGHEASAVANIEFLDSIPVNPIISRLCDEGKIEEYKSTEFASIAQRIIEKTKQLKVPQELRRTESSQ